MSTWTNKARLCALILGLAACQMDTGGPSAPGQARAMSVLGGAVTVAAPSGYCVDKASARSQGDGAVVLIGRCNGQSQSPPAVISVTIGTAGSAGVMASGSAALAAFFQSTAGRAALSRSGQAETVQILAASETGGAFLLHVAEAGQGDYWRAVFGLSGRLVTLSVQGTAGAALDAASGRRLLGAAISTLQKANKPAVTGNPVKAVTIG